MGTIAKLKYGDTTHLIASTCYGTCPTEATTVAKVATIQDSQAFSLINGITIHIKFTYHNEATNPTLNVNSTGAKAIKMYGTSATGKTATASWYDGSVVSFTYDGTNWIQNDYKVNTNTTYSAGTGLSLSSTTFNHSNSVTAQTTQAVYPIKIDAQGHISAYGTSPTTLSGYGITDANIDANGKITLGSSSITPLTSSSTLDATKLSGTIPSGCYTNTKNTTGADNTTSKIYLVGPTDQTTSNGSARTYSNVNCYASGGKLYSNGSVVLTAHQSVTDNNPTLAWSTKSKVATIGSTDIHVTMPSNPNTDENVLQSVLSDSAGNWRKIAIGFYNNANPATTATEQTNKIWVSNKLEYQASRGMLSIGISNDDGVFPNGGIKCHDVRDVSTVSSQEGANFIMTNNDLSGWWSGLHFKSSGGTYAAWELVGYANNGDGRTQPLYVRTSNKTTAWGSWRKIYDSSNPPTASEVSALPDTTKYAGSSSVGGSATSAVKLDTATAGTLTQPCYFTGGKPAACTYELKASVPANAEFTDTWDAMVGATSSAAGTKGYIGVDPPKSGYNTKFWGADATWKTAVTSVTIKGTSPISVDSESAITTTGTRTISLGTVPIANGGTGGTTALAATNNLGALNWASQGIKLTTENIDTDLTNGYTYYCVDAASTVNLSGTFPKGIQRESGATTGGSGFKIVCLQNYNSNYKFQILLTSNASIYYRAYTSGGSFGMWRIISQSTSVFYGTCSTAAATAAKTVTLSGNQMFELVTGVTINVKFSNYNSATSPTLSVNGTTAKPIVKFGTTAVGTGTATSWRSGAACTFTYDGTSWVLHEYEPYCVAQANVTGDYNYQLLMASTSGTSTTSWFTATNKSAKLYFNPSSGSLSVNGYVYGAPFGITSYTLSTASPLKWGSGYALASQSGATVQIIIQLLGSGAAATGGTDAYHGTLTGGPLPARDMTLIGYTGSTVIMGWLTTTGDLTARPMTNVTVGDGSGIYLTGTFIGM